MAGDKQEDLWTPGCQVLSFLWFSVFFNDKKNDTRFLENGENDILILFSPFLYMTSQHLLMTRTSLQVRF